MFEDTIRPLARQSSRLYGKGLRDGSVRERNVRVRDIENVPILGMPLWIMVVAIAVTDSGRPLARVGGLQKHEIKGEDGLR